MSTEEIRVRGTVQGVGFRPTVYRLAKAYGLQGEVCNDGQGVLIRASGRKESIEEFVQKLQKECPPLARIDEVTRKRYEGKSIFHDFVISQSVSSVVTTEIPPDAATCGKCKAEIFDPFSRWYRYPFTNCTHCGPRLSIIRAMPYDRGNTSMAAFGMCAECRQEYNDVANRRFHAQPIACQICGPKTWLERSDSKPITPHMFSMLDDVDAVCTLLQKGEIVAIKGLGGFHLACDATQEKAVQKLRQRKQRHQKPFALMAKDMEVIEEYCTPNAKERELLESPAAPIVLIQAKGGDDDERGSGRIQFKIQNSKSKTQNSKFKSPRLAPSIAPGQNTLGFMLPNTPLHHLILRRMNRPIVLTSGNLSDEPQSIDNVEAREKLGKIADYFLLHNRDIVNRVDDSVVRVVEDKVLTIRRARGYAPASINLPPGFESVPQILAMGSQLKNTFCLLRDGKAILSQHQGDLENPVTFQSYQDTLNLYLNIFEHQPEAIAVDLHPEYLSTKLGEELAASNQVKLYPIQHHHAHIAACMAENGLDINSPPVLGIALDGLGYGEDETLWGGEFLLADYRQFKRLATFKPVAMIGGKQAMKEPWRNTYAQLISAFAWDELKQKYGNLDIVEFLQQKPLKLLNQLIEKQLNSPLSSSVGRLFDAVAAAIGICREECSYEGQAAIEMEALADTTILDNKENLNYYFNFVVSDSIYHIDSRSMWQALLNDLQQHTPQAMIAAKFHTSLAHAIVEMVDNLRQKNDIHHVVLTGGVFQNCILLEQVSKRLQALEINVLTHSLVPANDGGLSLGQAVIAAAQLMN
ncbi:hydrogenase maturation protein HypF [Scytonema sp. HK-05]|uniref:carbamoyltransferase HypF n=1 Tax=Scytonema sp. HK-05 TaxID=1137095 RepID=UPI0009356B43|nr:carbamoyltransferase HypF [Scytonema sp. HK-05]OKH56796.1 carbamoyltransferase HypF [Scytonema sp. HK-05]BAY44976.1 hydrogenase maturation protein HypF [Scytonema sp. HK-05]